MSVVSITPYPVNNKDRVDNFHGAQLLYVGWDKHMLFYAPTVFCLSPDLLFSDLCTVHLPQAFAVHPDFAGLDWPAVQWLKSGQPWTPDHALTLAQNGLVHKELLRMQTPVGSGRLAVGI